MKWVELALKAVPMIARLFKPKGKAPPNPLRGKIEELRKRRQEYKSRA